MIKKLSSFCTFFLLSSLLTLEDCLLTPPSFIYNYSTGHDIREPSSQRLHNFLEELVKELLNLKQQIDAVSFDNPTFQTTFEKAITIARNEHQQEKLAALRNAVLNSAIPNFLKDDLQAIFLKWIDELTVSHIKLLRMLDDIYNYQIDNYEDFLDNLEDLEEEILANFPVQYLR